MSELPELPPAPRNSRPLLPGGLESAVAGGRRRRQRALAIAGGAGSTLALLIAALVVQPGSSRPDSLQIAERPTASPGPSPAADVPEPAATVGPEPGGGSTAAPVAAGPVPTPRPAPPSSPGAPAPVRPGAQAPGPAGAPVPVDQRPAYVEDTDEDASGGAGCAVGGSCSYQSGGPPEVVRRGQQVQIVLGMCKGTNDIGDSVYSFAGGQEKDVVVVDDDDISQEVFRFSSTVRYVEGPHERRLRRGSCIQWTGRWDLVRTDGEPVAAGSYTISMRVRADSETYENGPPVDEPLDAATSLRVTVLDGSSFRRATSRY